MKLKQDFLASLTVFLIALPLGLGISVASGFPPMAGIVSGIIGGILVGALSGAPLQVTGAAAGLTVIVLDGVNRFGIPTMGVVVALAGVFQMIGAAARTGKLFQAISPSVVGGMLAGIGFLIIKGQGKTMITDPQSIAIGALTILLLVALPKIKGAAKLPAPLIAVGGAAILAAIIGFTGSYVSLPSQPFASWTLPSWNFGLVLENPNLLALALELALIASAESLLCAAAVDQMHAGERTNYDRELGAQGVGNLVCGLLGALPVTGVIVRSSANVRAGAKTRWSSIFHGLWLILLVAFFPQVLELVPMAGLAALLVHTGVKLLNLKGFAQTFKRERGEFAVMATTFVCVVTIDLLSGVLIGLALAVARVALSLSELKLDVERQPSEDRLVLQMSGAATFLRLPKLASTLASFPANTNVVLRSADLRHIDEACIVHLQSWAKRHKTQGGRFAVECQRLAPILGELRP